MKSHFLFFILVVLLSGSIVQSQTVPPRASLLCHVDFSRFRYSQDQGLLDVSFSAYPSGITLLKKNDTLEGGIIFKIEAWNVQKDSAIYWSPFILPVHCSDTALISEEMGFIGKKVLLLPLGTYKILVYYYDEHDRSRRDSLSQQISLENYDTSASVSDLILSSQIVESQQKGNLFYKNSFEVVPNPSLIFGSSKKPVVFIYSELYNLEKNKSYIIDAQIYNFQNTQIKQRKRTRQFSISNSIDVTTMNIASLPSGKYNLQVNLTDSLGTLYAHSEKKFFVYNPLIQPDSVSVRSAKSAEFGGLSDDELIEEFNRARYLTNTDDIKMFEKLTTKEARQGFLAAFWADIESGKRGWMDITHMQYQQRISTATKRYRAMGREGWRTDRGRVYVLYGEPDEVDRVPSSENTKPYESWRYFQIESGVQFVFVDRSGFGEYMLVHSTKRGELQDEGWERFLR